jgi:hypothetical protein
VYCKKWQLYKFALLVSSGLRFWRY